MNFLGSSGSLAKSRAVILGAPYDATCCFRQGTKKGPDALRSYSENLEEYSPYQKESLLNRSFYDAGNIPLNSLPPEKAHQKIYAAVKKYLNKNKKVLLFGGEHSVSFGSIKACKEKFENLTVFQFDAHLDLRKGYLGEKYSHASIMRNIIDDLKITKIYQTGIRSGTEEEFARARKNKTLLMPKDIKKVLKTVKGPVYITFDMDALDPSCAPGTGTPEAGGLTFNEALGAVLCFKNKNIAGADIVELSPKHDISGITAAAAAKLAREIILMMA